MSDATSHRAAILPIAIVVICVVGLITGHGDSWVWALALTGWARVVLDVLRTPNDF